MEYFRNVLQAYYKDTWITLIEAVLVSFFVKDLGQVKIISFKCSGALEEIYGADSSW